MYKRLFLTLMMALAIVSVSARYKGAAPVAGQQYYLLNVYQSKFLTTGNTLITDKQGTPALFTATSATSITVNSTAYTIEASDYGYVLKNGGNALMFNGGGYIHDDATGKDFLNVPNAGVGVHVAAITNNTTKDCAQWLFVSTDEYNAMQDKKTFTTCALNVDGMPKSVKVAGVYEVKLNDDAKEGPGATAIGAKMRTLGYDVVGLSEDFNYHTEIMNAINDGGKLYTDATHRGVISAGLGAVGDYLGKKTIFDTDGLGLLARDAAASFSGESWTKWNEHNGYDDSGADGLINKGFRYYLITLSDGTTIDLYILHMDAETNPGDNAARESQMQQLAAAIIASNNGNPIIIMGDTNCRYTRDPLKKKFIDVINADERFTCKDVWIEHCRGGIIPPQNNQSIMVDAEGYRRGEVVDKVFYINNTASDIRIVAEQFRQDISFVGADGYPLADHWPMVTEFSYHDYDPAIDDAAEEANAEQTFYLRNVATGNFLKQGGRWGTHALQGVYGSPMTLEKLSDGKYNLRSSAGYVNSGAYMDGGSNDTQWSILQRNGHYIFTFNNNASALSADDPYIYNPQLGPNVRYVWNSNFNISNTYQQWDMLTKEDLLKEARYATPEKPYNLTFMLPGANFDRNDSQRGAWNIEKSDNRPTPNLTGDGGFHADDDFANYVGEVYVNTGSNGQEGKWKVNQVLKGMPKGTYRITLQAFQVLSNNETTEATIDAFANGVKARLPLRNSIKNTEFKTGKEIKEKTGGTLWNQTYTYYYVPNTMEDAAKYFNNGYYSLELLNVNVTDDEGTLDIGIEKTSDTGRNNKAWACFDNFQIFYLGDGNAYNVIHDDVLALTGEGSRAIASALSEYPYATAAEAKADGNDDAYINTATEVLKNAVTISNNADDATCLLTNADFSQNTTGWNFRLKLNDGTETTWNAGTVNGALDVWRGDFFQESDLSQTLTNLPNGTYKVSADFMTWASDYLKGDGSSSTDGHSWIGFYGAPADGDIVRTDNIVGDAPTQGETGSFTRYTFYVNVPNHDLTIGVRNDVTRFFQIKNVTVEMVNHDAYQAEVAKGCIYQDMCWLSHDALEYDLTAAKYSAAENVDLRTGGFVQQPNALIRANVGAVAGDNVIVGGACDNLVITDKAPFQNSAAFTAKVATYERAMAKEWGTVMLPYDVTSDDAVKYYVLKKVNAAEDGTMTFAETETLEAGTPGVFIKQDDQAASVTLGGSTVEVQAGNGETFTTDVTGWSMVGTYNPLTLDATTSPDALYYISDNKFWHATGTLTVAPFRAWFTGPKASEVRSFRLVVGEDDADEIQLVPTDASAGHDVYTLSGVRLPRGAQLKPGLYIINNKKTLVK